MASIGSIESIDVLRHRHPPHRAALEWQLVDCPTTGGQSSPHHLASHGMSWLYLEKWTEWKLNEQELSNVYSIHTFWAFSLQSSDEALVSKRFWLVENPRFPKQTFYEDIQTFSFLGTSATASDLSIITQEISVAIRATRWTSLNKSQHSWQRQFLTVLEVTTKKTKPNQTPILGKRTYLTSRWPIIAASGF